MRMSRREQRQVIANTVVLLVLSAFLASAASGERSPAAETAAQGAVLSEKKLAELEGATSRIRGLKFQREVDYQLTDESGVREIINTYMNEEFPGDKLERLSVAYAKLGLIEAGLNLRETILALYSEQLAAFYDQKKKKLYSIKDLPFSEEFHRVLMVHELTHALQDQNFDISKLPLEIRDNDDRAMAALSLLEGDATLVFTQYATEGVRLGFRDIFAALTVGQKELAGAPRVIRKNLLFPYSEGSKFVTRLFRKGGWEAVNQAYKDPPQSSEQILHPEKYLDTREDPIPIPLPDLSSLAGRKWELLEDNVLGELNTGILFTEFLGSIRAARPSKGWGGDRFQVYRTEGTNETILAWVTAWDTEKDREEFVSCYTEVMKGKCKGKKFRTVEGKDYSSLVADGVVMWLGWADKGALALEAPDETTLLAMLWEFTKTGRWIRPPQDEPAAESAKN